MFEPEDGQDVSLETTPEVTTEQISSDTASDTGSPDGTAEETAEVQPYTEAELEELIKTDGEIDRKRLTPAMEAIRRTFERGYTPRFQEAAALRQQAEQAIAYAQQLQQQQMQNQTPANPKAVIFQKYVQNPAGTTHELNQAVNALASIPFDDDRYPAAQQQIAQINAIKDEMFYSRQALMEQQYNHQNLNQAAVLAIQQDIPDYATVQPALFDFTVKEGIDPRLISTVTRPDVLDAILKSSGIYDINGAQASAMLTRFVHSNFKRANAGKTADGKEVKTPPPGLARQTGSTGPATSAGNMSTEEWIRKRNEETRR